MPVAPDLRGITLGDRYELSQLIGEGAFGRVYRGRDLHLEREVAIKVIKPWWAEDPEWVATFRRETRLLASLNHPGIVQIHDVGHTPEGLFYVSELVDGEDLAARLRRHRAATPQPAGLAPEEARRIALGLCRALAGAHARGIVHRDVKPANVLLAGDPVRGIKVADFGVARLAAATTAGGPPSLVVGTPRYMAPEQGRGEPTTAATDVYGVGIVLYEMLAGAPPFAADSPVALALAHERDPVPPLPDRVPAALAQVVATALAKDPADRYADAGEMAAALGAARTDGGRTAAAPVAAIGDGTVVQPRRGPRRIVDPAARRRSLALLGLAAGVVAALVVAALLVGGGSGPGPRRATAGPATVEVPLLVGRTSSAAAATLRARRLRVELRPVPAPGVRPGTVTAQQPLGGHALRAGGVVTLSVAETPRWRPVATFSAGDSGPVTIRGERWRILATVSGATHCAVLGLFCRHSSATVLRRSAGDSRVTSVALGDGTGQAHVFTTGPGTYRVDVTPASSSTRWTIQVQDDY